MSIEHLRALALSEPPTCEYVLCLDRGVQLEMISLRARIGRAEKERTTLEQGGNLPRTTLGDTDPHTRIDRQIKTLTSELAELEQESADNSIVLIFKRLPTSADSADEDEPTYTALEAQHTDDKRQIDFDALADSLLAACYLRADSRYGDVGLTWAEAQHATNVGDRDQLRALILGHHRMASTIPFDPRSSGSPETT